MEDIDQDMTGDNKARGGWMFWLAVLVLAAGAGVALIAMAAPMGYRLELWGYRTAFSILRTVVPWSPWIAGIGLVTAIALAVLGRGKTAQRPARLVGFTLAGTVIAAVAWYVPNAYLEPEGVDYPSIHDISTDTVNPPRFVEVLPLRADAPNGAEYGVSRDMNPELLVKLTREAYPDLQAVVLDLSPEQTFDRVMTAVESLGWELVAADRQAGRIEAIDSTFWFGFKDDIVIRIRPQGPGSRVDARSVSRVGKGDVGVNARRLRRFMAVLQG